MLVVFPAHTGLKPRKYDNYDRLCLKYYYAINNKAADSIKIEKELVAFGANINEFDFAYSHGKNIAENCKIVAE